MKRMKKFLSLLCAGLVLCGSFGGLGVQASEPAETSENTTQVRHRPGYIRTLYPTKYHDRSHPGAWSGLLHPHRL